MRAVIGIVACLAGTAAIAKEPRRNVDAFKTMDAFGRCVGRHQVDGMKLLATIPNSPEEHKQALRISTSDCLSGGSLQFRPGLLRGAVAQALLQNAPAALRRAKAVPAFDAPNPTQLAAAPEDQRAAVALVLFGECVASQNSTAVMALLQTPVESQAEKAAFAPLDKAMTRCSQVTFKVDRFQMRGFLAEGAYRLALKSVPSA